jgi:hypothetical protein
MAGKPGTPDTGTTAKPAEREREVRPKYLLPATITAITL